MVPFGEVSSGTSHPPHPRKTGMDLAVFWFVASTRIFAQFLKMHEILDGPGTGRSREGEGSREGEWSRKGGPFRFFYKFRFAESREK